MKITDNNGTITCEFDSENEKQLIFDMIRRHIDLMPKVYRQRHCNWYIVHELTNNGSGYSSAICRALGVNANEYEWEKETKNGYLHTTK